MKNLSVFLPAVALMVALSGSAMADNGAINSATLNAMGLAGIELMSDDAAMEIRGLGYKRGSLAFGISYATTGGRRGPSAGTLDGYLAHGKYMAMGDHYSEAGMTRTKTTKLFVKGRLVEKKVRIRSMTVGAGGGASASSL
jgi:hypothetical protein